MEQERAFLTALELSVLVEPGGRGVTLLDAEGSGQLTLATAG